MRLTAKKAVEITREAWLELAETGADTKEGLLVWEKYGWMLQDCPLCAYVFRYGHGCELCPLWNRWEEKESCGEDGTPWDDWCTAGDSEGRKAAAQRLVNLCDKWLEDHATR